MFIKKFFAVLALILITLSTAQADYLGDLCDDLYSQIQDPNVGTTTTKEFFKTRVRPEVEKMTQAQIYAESLVFYNRGAGQNIKTSGKSLEEQANIYLSNRTSMIKAKKLAWGAIRTESKNPDDVDLIPLDKDGHSYKESKGKVDKLPNMSGGQKLRVFFLAHFRYLQHERLSITNSITDSKAKKEFESYQTQLFGMVLQNIIKSLPKKDKTLEYIYN